MINIQRRTRERRWTGSNINLYVKLSIYNQYTVAILIYSLGHRPGAPGGEMKPPFVLVSGGGSGCSVRRFSSLRQQVHLICVVFEHLSFSTPCTRIKLPPSPTREEEDGGAESVRPPARDDLMQRRPINSRNIPIILL